MSNTEQKTKLVPVPSDSAIPERDVDKMPVLYTKHLGIDFGGLTAVDDLNLTIGATEIAGLIGPNGAGKSTLLNCACDLLTPQNGEVLLEENNIRKLQRKDIAKVIGYVQQTQMSTFSYTVFDYVLMGRAATIGTF